MGKKTKNSSSLGRALIKNQQQTNRGRKHTNDNSLLHTTEIPDGYDWGRLNLQSVTEESSFQEFLSTAELAGTEYTSEKLNITFVNPATNIGLLTDEETRKIKQEHENNKGQLTIPRRPPWTANMSVSELENNERNHFLEWRRKLAVLQDEKGLLMTPYEKNLEFWRQLWRVVERSDVVVQIVDARNPLLFRCEDLEKYVKEVCSEKINFILLNKADFLTREQRQYWYDYFKSIQVQVAFFSAVAKNNPDKDLDRISESESPELDKQSIKSELENLENAIDSISNNLHNVQNQIEEVLEKLSIDKENLKLEKENTRKNEIDILSREELIQLFKTIHTGKKVTQGVTTIGLVGYPNVGKSSTINTLMTEKKVSVSATPGKTKHFQTLYLDTDLLLCDCPGLVMPSFVFTKAEMIINGILPIDQMRDHVPPINLVCKLIPRHIFEDNYGIMIPKPLEEEENPNRPPTSEELLNAYGYMRGFMTANGQPDNPRSARYILKDFVNGKILYCTAPPGVPQEEYHKFPERRTKKVRNENMLPPREVRVNKSLRETAKDVDSKFFKTAAQGIHTKGSRCISSGLSNSSEQQDAEKPWKKLNKHSNKNKKEKLRRVYAHLDQH